MASPAGQKLIRSAMRERVFAPAYLLHGEDDFLKEELLREVLDSALDAATRDFNLEVRRAAALDPGTLGSLLDSPPMMADRRAVVLRDIAGLRKDTQRVLDEYLQRPAPDVLLVLVAPAGWKIDKRLADRTVPVEFAPLTGERVPKWIIYHVEHDLRTTITPDAVTLLQDAAGSDLGQLNAELEKLASYCAGRPIDDAAVAAVVGVQRGGTLGNLLDAVGRRDAREALTLLPIVLQQPKTSAVTTVMALATQTLALAWAAGRRRSGVPLGRLSGELFALLKDVGSVYTGRAWGEAVSAWCGAVDRWTSEDLTAALDALLAADQSLKDTRVSSDEQLLATLILELCTSRFRRVA